MTRDLTALLGPELHGLAWLLTYSLHAALAAIAVALSSRWLRLSAAQRHTAWKCALLAPFASTLLAFVAGGAASAALDVQSLTVPVPSLALDETSARHVGHVLDVLGAAAVASALLGVLRFGIAALALRQRLAGRKELTSGPFFEVLERARARFAQTPVTLSQSPDIDSPLVLGRAEICIPVSGLAELSEAELEAVFAHELAHLERGDGIWFPLVGLVGAALWLHPVTRWVCAQARQSAELACDARCVEVTGEPRALALALIHFATRAVATRRTVALPTMAQPQSGLVARVAQLTGASAPTGGSAPRAPLGLMLGLALLAVSSTSVHVRVANARTTALHASQRVLEIEQNLRHAREKQRWLEAQLFSQ